MTERFPTKAFTVAEADQLVGGLRKTMREISRLGRRAEAHDERLQVLDALWGASVLEEGNPDHSEFVHHRSSLDAAMEHIREVVHNEITALGIRFPPGGIEHGLLDFPTTLDGRWVYLCWRVGEPTVSHWHEITDGFAGRRSVTPELRRRMGLERIDPS